MEDSAVQTVRDFIEAYYAWNDSANQRSRAMQSASDAGSAARETARIEYDALAARFFSTSVLPQPISFGDDPMHAPHSETIVSASQAGDKAIVRTSKQGTYGFVVDYEYQLVRESGEWRLTSLLYLTDDGAYECL